MKSTELLQQVLEKKYVASIFDIDGTLTIIGEERIPLYLCETLGMLSLKVPMAVCSGRLLEGALKRVAGIFAASPEPEKCRQQWLILTENGSVGYFYDEKKKAYNELYRAQYPYAEEHRKKLFEHLCLVFKNELNGSLMGQVGFNFSPTRYGKITGPALAEECKTLAKNMIDEMKKFDPENLLTAGASGIGVLVYPKSGSKERGTQEFAKFLRSSGFTVDQDCHEIVAVGDQPGEFGNDRTFLDGRFGTPFTVGEEAENSSWPLTVYEMGTNKKLEGPKGTDALMKIVNFQAL